MNQPVPEISLAPHEISLLPHEIILVPGISLVPRDLVVPSIASRHDLSAVGVGVRGSEPGRGVLVTCGPLTNIYLREGAASDRPKVTPGGPQPGGQGHQTVLLMPTASTYLPHSKHPPTPQQARTCLTASTHLSHSKPTPAPQQVHTCLTASTHLPHSKHTPASQKANTCLTASLPNNQMNFLPQSTLSVVNNEVVPAIQMAIVQLSPAS